MKPHIAGAKFERVLELMLTELGYQNVMRNVAYHKSKKYFRQVDVCYNYVEDGVIQLAMVEAKYSSNGTVKYQLRSPKQKVGGTIENVVDETEERRVFVGAKKAMLVTNGEVEPLVKEKSRDYGIVVIEGPDLERYRRELGWRLPIEETMGQMDNIVWWKNIIQLSR